VRDGREGIKQFLLNIPGNVAIMVPFGIFLPALFKKVNKWQRVMLAAATLMM
jgi:glycopeptide antibiotics resistance protein